MRVVGIGSEIVEVLRIAQMIERHGDLFLQRVFTQAEIEFCNSRKAVTQHYGGRWAAKQAVLRALNMSWTPGVTWHDLEIRSHAGGRTTAALGGPIRQACERLEIVDLPLTVSHCRHYATAYALAIAQPPLDGDED